MKKIFNFLGVLLILFFVFACTLPSEIEISGSPSLKFAANMDFGDCFNDMIETFMNDDGKTKIVPCTNPSLNNLTYVLRLELFKDDFILNDTGSNTITINDDILITLLPGSLVSSDVNVVNFGNSHTLSFKGLEDYLDGFKFKDIQSKIYIYGSDLAKVLSIELTNEHYPPLNVDIHDGVSSGVENKQEFTGPSLPLGGAIFNNIENIINDGEDITFNYRIYIKGGQPIESEWLNDTHSITAELVIWLPMEFESTKPNAEFKFPDFFNDIGDMIKSLSGAGCIENMNFTIAIDPLNPFSEGLFMISDDGYEIENTPDNHNFYIKFTKEQIDYINNNPFNPRFYILYPTITSHLDIPKGDIMITTVSFNADFIYNVEL